MASKEKGQKMPQKKTASFPKPLFNVSIYPRMGPFDYAQG